MNVVCELGCVFVCDVRIAVKFKRTFHMCFISIIHHFAHNFGSRTIRISFHTTLLHTQLGSALCDDFFVRGNRLNASKTIYK